MANSYPNYQTTAGALPDRDTAVTGQDVAGEYWQDVAGLCNHNFGREALPRIGQSWAGGTCKLNADGAMIQGLRIPLVSSRHLALTCYVRAFSNAASACSVTFREAGGASASVVIATTSASGSWYSASLALPAAGDYAQVSFEASSMAGADVLTVLDFAAYVTPLSSPLAATAVGTLPTAAGTFVPLGNTASGPDRPLNSSMLRYIRDDIAGQYERRRVLYSWTALTAAVAAYTLASTGKNVSATSMQARPHPQMPRVQELRDERMRSATIYALCTKLAAASELVVELDGGYVVILPVGSGGGTEWVTASIDMTQAPPALSTMGRSRVIGITVHPSTAAGASRPRSTAELLSITIWGV